MSILSRGQKQILVWMCAWFLTAVGAVQAVDLTVSPAQNYIQIDGGEEQILDYILSNEDVDDLQVSLSAMSFATGDLDGKPILSARLDFPYLSLLSAGETVDTITLAAGSSQTVQVKVAPPLGTPVKEYPLVLLFEARVATPDDQVGSGVGMQVGSNLIVRLDHSNEDKSDLSIALVDNWHGLVDTFGRTSQQVLVRNRGSFGTLINGEVTLRRGQQEVAHWDFYPDLVLGESERLARVSDGSIDGNGNISLSSSLDLPPFLLGHYTLEARVHSIKASRDMGSTVTVSFIALPYWLLTLLVVIAVLVIITAKVSRPKTKKQQLQKRLAQMKRQKEFFE